MNDPLLNPFAFGLPEGRQLDTDNGRPDNHFGSISIFPAATAQRIEIARKTLPEVQDKNLDRSTDLWTDRATGAQYELVRSYLEVSDPASSGAVAFVVSDGNLIGLRPAGVAEKSTSTQIGVLRGG